MRVQLKESIKVDNVILPRRAFLKGLLSLFAAPAIVKVESLMPIKVWSTPIQWREGFLVLNGAMVKTEDFPTLFDIFGHTFGGRGRTFRLPEGGSPVSETLTSTDGARAAHYYLPERVPNTFGQPRLKMVDTLPGRGWAPQDFFRPPYCWSPLASRQLPVFDQDPPPEALAACPRRGPGAAIQRG
jgi:Phage Tail Collar Domain